VFQKLFMEPERSLPCFQELTAGPYPEPSESSLHPQMIFFRHVFEYYPPTYTEVSYVVSALYLWGTSSEQG